LFYWGRISGPGGKAACDVGHTFLGAAGAAVHCAAIKNSLKFFIKKQYEIVVGTKTRGQGRALPFRLRDS